MNPDAWRILPEKHRFRVVRPDGALTRAVFHSQAQAQEWIDNHAPQPFRSQSVGASQCDERATMVVLSRNYYGDNELAIMVTRIR